jgi:hypothetical protein
LIRLVTRSVVILAGLVLVGIAAIGTSTVSSQEQTIDPADYSTTIDNPLFPLSLLGPKLFIGEEADPDTGEVVEERLESRVLPQTETVAGVRVLVLEERAYTDGGLVEVALDYFAQHRDGSVYYFGERVDNYEDGLLRDHAGQWLAGEGDNLPGIIMPAQPVIGQTYQQERAPGVAEDAATVLSTNETVTVPAGRFTGCLKTRDFNPLEPDVVEFKYHCPGVGLTREEAEDGFLALEEIGPPPAVDAASPTAPPTPPVATTVAPAGVTAPDTGSGTTAERASRGRWALYGAALVLGVLASAGIVVAARRHG